MKETDLTYVKPGNHVDVTVDTYPGQVWSGTVGEHQSCQRFAILGAAGTKYEWQLG